MVSLYRQHETPARTSAKALPGCGIPPPYGLRGGEISSAGRTGQGRRLTFLHLSHKSLLRCCPVTSVNGIPADGSAGGGTGPAPRRAARRQPAPPRPPAPAEGTGTPGPTPAVTLIPPPAK